jgi:hypothetical protein
VPIDHFTELMIAPCRNAAYPSRGRLCLRRDMDMDGGAPRMTHHETRATDDDVTGMDSFIVENWPAFMNIDCWFSENR